MGNKILIVALNEKWIGIGRLPFGLTRSGFEVYTLCPQKSYLAKTIFVKESIQYPIFTYSRLKSIYILVFFSFIKFKPDFIIPGDEDALLVLQNISNFFMKIPVLKNISKIIRRSLALKEFDRLMLEKSNFQNKCLEWGINTPRNIVIKDIDSAIMASTELTYPVVLKNDSSYGGSGVYICQNENDLRENYLKMKSNLFLSFLKSFFFISIFGYKNKISVQKYIKGSFGQAPFCAKDGKVFASNIMLSLKNFPNETGGSTVVRGIENDKINQYINILVQKTFYTGFGSIEFILEEKSGLPYVIELNPRPTPTCHIGSDHIANDLCEYLYKGLQLKDEKLGTFRPYTIALFPGEKMRDPKSKFLSEGYHDIPVNDSGLLKMFESTLLY